MTLFDRIEAIKNIAVPTTKKQLRTFIGLISYCRDIWQHRSEILTPLSAKYDFQTRQMELE